MAQTVKLLQEKGLTDEDALNRRIGELETKYHDALAVVKGLEGRMKANRAALSHRSLHQHQEHRTAVQYCQATLGL